MKWATTPLTWIALLITPVMAPIEGMAVPFTNGSFEVGPSEQPYYAMLSTGSTSIAGWTVNEGTIDYITGYWPAAEGVRSVDLNGDRPGSISQAFDTVPGMGYDVLFDMAGNVDGGASLKTLQVAAGGLMNIFALDTTADSHGVSGWQMSWQPQRFFFTAIDGVTTLSFRSLSTDSCCWGPVIDNVQVQAADRTAAVPEPSALHLLCTGVAGLLWFRRTIGFPGDGLSGRW